MFSAFIKSIFRCHELTMQSIIITFVFFALTTCMTVGLSTPFHQGFFQEVAAETDKSFIISPLSLRSSLALLHLGAEGETVREIEKTLHMGAGTKREHARRYKVLIKRITKKISPNGEVKFHIVNRIYVRCQFQILASYIKLAERYMNASAENIDFLEKVGAAKKINDWVGEQTDHKIENIIQPESLGRDTQLVLVNAIYFNASWKFPFAANSGPRDFFLEHDKKVKVRMMRQVNTFFYGTINQLDAQIIELPYKGTNLKMIVILPNGIEGLRDLELQLKYFDIRKLRKYLNKVLLKVELPKFRISYKQALNEILENMGVSKIFHDADLSSLANGDLHVSQVEQAAVIEVDEFSTVAAASTKIAISNRKGLANTNITFTADHPFFFAILNFEVILFSGRVNSF